MAAKRCPKCGDATDFYIDEAFKVCCGYCGHPVARIKEQFQQAKSDCVVAERVRKLKMAAK